MLGRVLVRMALQQPQVKAGPAQMVTQGSRFLRIAMGKRTPGSQREMAKRQRNPVLAGSTAIPPASAA